MRLPLNAGVFSEERLPVEPLNARGSQPRSAVYDTCLHARIGSSAPLDAPRAIAIRLGGEAIGRRTNCHCQVDGHARAVLAHVVDDR